MTRRLTALVLAAVLLGGAAACSSDDDAGSAEETTTTAAGGDTSTTAADGGAGDALQILVTNDDGYDAEGIDALVEGLAGLPDVEVTVVAPLEQQSGTGGNETEGPLEVTEVTLASGTEARAVDGFPSDSVRVAIDELEVEADLVISGINEGQNLGPVIDASGTVGAARAGVARGIPALAVSQGLADEIDYSVAVSLVLDWVQDQRSALLAGEAPVAVTSLNVPSCTEGAVRGLAEVTPDVDGDGAASLGASDCVTEVDLATLEEDVEAFLAGYATISELPAEPAAG